MFSLFKKKNDIDDNDLNDGLIKTKPGVEIIDFYKNEIELIYTTLQVSRDNFDSTYLPFIIAFTDFIQTLPCPNTPQYNKPEGLIKLCLLGGLNAVKKRRGFVLPPGTRTDIQDLQRSVWSYAIFTSAVIIIIKNHIFDCEIEVTNDRKEFTSWSCFEGKGLGEYKYIRFRKSFIPNTVSLTEVFATFIHIRFLPKEGLKWLMMDDALFKEWCACATGNIQYVDWIKDFAYESYYCPTVGQQTKVVVVDSSSGEVIQESIQKEVTVKSVMQNNNTAKNEQQPLTFNSDIEAINIDDTKKINTFFEWMETSYNQGKLVLNMRESVIHSVKGGIFTLIPIIFKRYEKECDLNSNDIKELEVIIMGDTENGFVKSESNKNIHVYKAYGKIQKGFIIKFSVLGIDKQPLISTKVVKSVESNPNKSLDSF